MSGTSSQLPPSDLMEALLKDPIKRTLILQLLNQEKDNIEKYKRQELKDKTPLKRVKRAHCESPTALQRRRALEQKDSTSEGSLSDVSEIATQLKGPELPFEELLKGVVAYVEVKRDNQDRSEGIKAVMKLMGATVKDKFTNDVTHVIFKDGCFTTFEKAKLMKVHLVSVLWLDAVRRNNARVPEKNYPAFGNRVCDANVSILCSQIQKDYEDVIRDERRRRHTMMTPKTSFSSYLTAQNVNSSDDESTPKPSRSPELTSDDSDCGVIDGRTTKRPATDVLSSSQLTDDVTNSSSSTSLLSRVNVRNNRKTINVVSDMVLTPNRVVLPRTKSSEKMLHSTPEEPKKASPEKKKVLKDNTLQSSTMSSLRMSTDTDRTKSGLGGSKQSDSGKGKTSSVGGKENCSITTSMSSLRVGESPTRKSNEKKKRSKSASLQTAASEDVIPKTPSDGSVRSARAGRTRRSQSASKPSQVHTKGTVPAVSPSNETGTDDMTSNNRRSKRIVHKEVSKGRSNADLILSESEDETSKKKESPPNLLEKSLKTGSLKKNRRKALADSESDFEDLAQSTKKVKEKSERRTSIMPPSNFEIENSSKKSGRRNQKAIPTLTDDRVTRGNRNSIARAIFEDEPKAPEEKTATSTDDQVTRRNRNSVARAIFEDKPKAPEDKTKEVKPAEETTGRKGKRASSVVPPISEQESNKVRRSASVDRKNGNVSVTPLKGEATRKNQKPDTTPSPAKKSRVEQTSTAKKTRKLYVPNDIAGLSPLEEDKEREEYLKQKTQKSPDGVFLNPNTIHVCAVGSKKEPKKPSSVLDNWSDESEAKIVKVKARKGKKKEKTPPRRSSTADEQRELLELLNKVNSPQKRRSERLSLSQTQPKYTFSSESDNLSSSSLPITPINRRSTLDFMSLTQSQRIRRLKLDPKKTESIVCTKMHRHEVVNFEKAVGKLGRFFVEDKVTGKTTHLVAGEAKRTINMLRAIARGCWILKHEWLLQSQKVGKWLNEEDYELTEFSPAVQQCRLQREAFGPLFSMDIFKDCGFIYVGNSTTPRAPDLRELISICKGKVTTMYRNAEVIVGEYFEREGATCVTEMWVLDSVHFNKLKSFKHYLIKPAGEGDSPHF